MIQDKLLVGYCLEIIADMRNDTKVNNFLDEEFSNYSEYDEYCIKHLDIISVLVTYSSLNQLISDTTLMLFPLELLSLLKVEIYKKYYINTDKTENNNPLNQTLHQFLDYIKDKEDKPYKLISQFVLDKIISKKYTYLTKDNHTNIKNIIDLVVNTSYMSIIKAIKEAKSITGCDNTKIKENFYKKSKDKTNIKIEAKINNEVHTTITTDAGLFLVCESKSDVVRFINFTTIPEFLTCRSTLASGTIELIKKMTKNGVNVKIIDMLLDIIEDEKNLLVKIKEDVNENK